MTISSPFCQQLGCGVQAVGVQHGTARKTGQKLLHKGLCLGGAGRTLGGAAKAGAKQQNGCFLPPEQRHVFRGNTALGPCPAGAQAALRQAGCGGAHHRFHTGKGHDARPGAQCALCGQQCSAPVECAARHGQHTAKGALMAVPRAAGDILPDKFFGNFSGHSQHLRPYNLKCPLGILSGKIIFYRNESSLRAALIAFSQAGS